MNSRRTERTYNSFDFGNPNVIVEDVAYLYQSIYEGSNKKDQDLDGDKDFADVRIARMIASGMTREEAIRRVRNKSYNEAYVPYEGKPIQKLRNKLADLADRWGKPGVEDRFIKMSDVHSSLTFSPELRRKREQENIDRDAATARRKARLKDDFNLWVDSLLDEGYDLSDYTWDELYDGFIQEGVLGSGGTRLRPASERTQGGLTRAQRDRQAARERAEQKRQEALEKAAQAALNSIRGSTGRVSERPMGSVPPAPRPAAPGSDREDVRVLPTGLKKDNLGRAADRIIRSVQGGGKKKKPSLDDLLADIKNEGIEYELYNAVAEYLLDEGYVDDYESAEMMMENMSDEWLGEIFESKRWI